MASAGDWECMEEELCTWLIYLWEALMHGGGRSGVVCCMVAHVTMHGRTDDADTNSVTTSARQPPQRNWHNACKK